MSKETIDWTENNDLFDPTPAPNPTPTPAQTPHTMYITFYDSRATHVGHQFSIFDYAGALQAAASPYELSQDTSKIIKRTINRDKPNLAAFFQTHAAKHPEWKTIPPLPDFPIEDIQKHYNSFKIPKSDGGLRQIDAPDEALKKFLKSMKEYFETTLSILPSEAAHAYIPKRGCKTAIQVHQNTGKQNWFLKLDLHGFFPSHNLDYIMSMLSHIYPIGYLMDDTDYYNALKTRIQYALLRGALPQGSNLSPTLTNILMVPIDYHIQHNLYALDKDYIYTRYADDMLISSPYKTDYHEVEEMIINVIKTANAPFELNTKKTRYGSKAGSNWNLGMMLNGKNEITIGWRNAQRFRAMIFAILKDYSNHIEWSVPDKQHLRGIISYYLSVNREETTRIIKEYEKKFNLNLKKIMKPPKETDGYQSFS